MKCVALIVVAVSLLIQTGFAESPAKRKLWTYRNRKVSAEWIAEKYNKYAWQFAVKDGKCLDLGIAVTLSRQSRTLASQSTTPACDAFGMRIIQMVDRDAALAMRGQRTVYITGLAGSETVDRDTITALMMDIGEHSYTTVQGAKATVKAYEVIRRPTLEEFASAIDDGLTLYDYFLKQVPRPAGKTELVDPGNGGWKSGIIYAKNDLGGIEFYRVRRDEVR
jgi:hypothetical protein